MIDPLLALALLAPEALPLQSPEVPPAADQQAPKEAQREPSTGPGEAGTGARVRVDLGGGHELTGVVVKQTATQLFVDLGFTIVSVPREEIVALRGSGEADSAGAAPDAAPASGGLYRSGARSELSVRENVERVGEAAVLVRVPGGLGSGFVIDPAGWVVTNAHVIDQEQQISVTVLRRGEAGGELEKRVFEGVELVALNDVWDLALLRIPAEDLEGVALASVPLGQAGAVEQGEPVFALGNPMGLERTV
jgi:serine protease Do